MAKVSTAFVLCLVLICCKLNCILAKGRGHHKPPGVVGRAPEDPGTIFNVLKFGAQPNNKDESQAEAFVKAWRAACDSPGKATVLVPPGVFTLAETIFQGPCKAPPPTPITFQLQGTMKAVGDPSEYSDKSWISFEHVNGLVIIGGGTIDGNGPEVWKYNDCDGDSNCALLPASLYFNNVQNTKIKGLNFVNSMGFHIHITNSHFFRISGIHITAPPDSPNTDGMHISKSDIVKVSKSVISTGDDCISIGQGAVNVTINKVTCGPGHGISIGSLGKLPNELDVRQVSVQNCTLVGTTNGIRIKTWPASGPSRAAGFLFSNIIMDNVRNPIIIDQNYGTNSNKPSLVKISDIIYQEIKGTASSEVAVSLSCSSQVPCENVRFRNVILQPHTNTMRLSATCSNAKVGYVGVNFPPPCQPAHP